MSDLNQCNFIGRLGADPETRYMPNGDAVCSFRIAVGWKSKDKESAEWVSIVTFGKLAEICGQYLKKGAQVFVSGRFKTEEYEKDGSKRYSVKIVADKVQFLGGKTQSDGQSPPADRRPAPAARPEGGAKTGTFDDMDDDIPFLFNEILYDCGSICSPFSIRGRNRVGRKAMQRLWVNQT